MFVASKKDVNIFSNSRSTDKDCLQLNKGGNYMFDFSRTADNKLAKTHLFNEAYQWELYVCNYLSNTSIIPKIEVCDGSIVYDTTGMVSLRSFLQNNLEKDCTFRILNEVFCMIKNFKRYNFIHGNLHIDNIFIRCPFGKHIIPKIVVIDFSNSHVKNADPQFKRKNFLGQSFNYHQIGKYMDYVTFYLSFIDFVNTKKSKRIYKIQNHIDRLVDEYVPPSYRSSLF